MRQSTPLTPIVYIGIDVGLKTLQIHGLGRHKQLPNTALGHAKLLRLLPDHAQVIMESSGGYERVLWLALLRAQRKVSRLNATKVYHFAKSEGRQAKSDVKDAELLALYGQQKQPAPDVLPSEVQLRLQELISVREQLVKCAPSPKPSAINTAKPFSAP